MGIVEFGITVALVCLMVTAGVLLARLYNGAKMSRHAAILHAVTVPSLFAIGMYILYQLIKYQ